MRLIFLALLMPTSAFAQATLPDSWYIAPPPNEAAVANNRGWRPDEAGAAYPYARSLRQPLGVPSTWHDLVSPRDPTPGERDATERNRRELCQARGFKAGAC